MELEIVICIYTCVYIYMCVCIYVYICRHDNWPNKLEKLKNRSSDVHHF